MADIELEEVTVQHREVEVEGQIHPADEDPPTSTGKGKKRRRSRKRQNSASGHDSRESQRLGSPLVSDASQDRGGVPRRDGNPSGHSVDGKEKDRELLQEDFRAQFYEHYRKEAEEYDREFMKKHDEDLNTTLIFAGLFSAVTSAFIIQVHPQLQSDPTDETAALLRVILYKMDNTTFGGIIPPLPQWTGAPRTAIQVQAMLYASLAASLFSAFLAMLGKQWLNRYASTDMRGTGIERSRDRQRKLDGIITWYFDHVMESLPLMLQFALLLLGCALSLFLWEIHVTIACVVVGVTALGVAFYTFAVVAGSASMSCPYQTPGARILRHILSLLRSAFSALYNNSMCLVFLACTLGGLCQGAIYALLIYVLCLPFPLAYDACRLVWSIFGALIALPRRVQSWVHSMRSARIRRLTRRTDMLDSQCISWILQTSLEKGIRLSTLRFLATTPTLVDFNPAFVSRCFDILIDCIKRKWNPVIIQGMEQLAEASVMCFFLTYSHLSTMDPMSSFLVDIREHYRWKFPPELDLSGLPFSHTLGTIHETIYSGQPGQQAPAPIEWRDYEPTNREHVTVARAVSKLSWSEHQRKGPNSVPLSCLFFALHYLPQDPPPLPSIITDCLLIIAIHLECDVPKTMVSEESARPEVSDLIIQKLDTVNRPYQISHKTKAIDQLFLYAVHREQCGDTNLFDAILRLRKREFNDLGSYDLLWRLTASEVFTRASPRAAVLSGRYLCWGQERPADAQDLISKLVAGISLVPHTEELAESVVDTLLQIAANPHLRPSIPAGLWLRLNERRSLPPICKGRRLGDNRDTVRTVRGLNDIGILTSYLIMIWSEWKPLDGDGFVEMRTSVREDFDGVGSNGHHRAELIQRLDYILGELDRRSGGPDANLGDDKLWRDEVERHSPVMKDQYGELKRILQEVDQEATGTPNQSRSTFMCALPLPCP